MQTHGQKYMNPYIDSNFAATIFANGSLVGILRNDNPDTGKTYNLITAVNWKDNSSYKTHSMKPYDNYNDKNVIAQYAEDLFVWYDKRYDVLHSIWHYTYSGQDFPYGLHAFSNDGGHEWHAFLDFEFDFDSDGDGGDHERLGDYPSEWA